MLAVVLQISSEDVIHLTRAVFALGKRAMKLISSASGSQDDDDDEWHIRAVLFGEGSV